MKHKTIEAAETLSLPQTIKKHWLYLCSSIGERRAGSAGDQAAGEYILEQFRQAGLVNVHRESFPCTSVVKAEVELAMGTRGNVKPVPARVLAGAPGTSGHHAIEGDLVWI